MSAVRSRPGPLLLNLAESYTYTHPLLFNGAAKRTVKSGTVPDSLFWKPAMSLRTPYYRLHKRSGQAVVTLNGRDMYLGKHNTPESRAEYDRLIAEWLLNGRVLSAKNDLSINEMLVGYIQHCDEYYRRADGTPTSETASICQSLKPLKNLYGYTLANEFGPLKLKVCREAMIDSDLCRNECNKRTRRIVRAFKWASENEIVDSSIWQALKAVDGLRKGRSKARETKPVEPVKDKDVEAVLPHVLPPVAAMIRLQRLTGMRPGEVVAMRTTDLDMTGKVWLYRPSHHKTEHHGHERIIAVGPRSQLVLKDWLRENPDEPLFSPREAMEKKRVVSRANRKTKVQPSQLNRRKKKPKKQPSEQYTTHSYYYAIRRGCKKESVSNWHPHQLRYTRATELRKEFGIDEARVILGHCSPQMTELYAQLDMEKAIEIIEKVG